jgi:hypothetical protein
LNDRKILFSLNRNGKIGVKEIQSSLRIFEEIYGNKSRKAAFSALI